MGKATSATKRASSAARVVASTKVKTKLPDGMIVVKDGNGDHIPMIVDGVAGALDAVQASVEQIRSLMKNGKLTVALQKICERSILLGGVVNSLRKRGFKGDALQEALRLDRKKVWTKTCKGDDTFRTHEEQAHFNRAKTTKTYWLQQLELATTSTRGGKRANAGSKRKSETANPPAGNGAPEANPPAGNGAPVAGNGAPVAGNAPEASKPEQTLVPRQTAESFQLVKPAPTVQDAVQYLQMLGEGLKRTIIKNPKAFISDKIVADVVARIQTELKRLDNVRK